MRIDARGIARLAITGGVLVGLAAITYASATIASAVEYNLNEASGAAINQVDESGRLVGGPSIGVYIGAWSAYVLAAAGIVALLVAFSATIRRSRRQPGPSQEDLAQTRP